MSREQKALHMVPYEKPGWAEGEGRESGAQVAAGCLAEGFLVGSEGPSQQPFLHSQEKWKLTSKMPEGSLSVGLFITCSYLRNVGREGQARGW